jgi:nucleoside-diphosphate-sugar epimerase
MRCIVTGATGFIGNHLTDFLLAGGHDVICPVREPGRLRDLYPTGIQITTFEKLDDQINRGNQIDYVFHLAGATRSLDYAGYYRANVELTKNLLEFILRKVDRENFKRFVFVSSQAVNGPARDSSSCVTEYDDPNPVSLYGWSKLEAEQIVRDYGNYLPYVIVRPSTVFGPGDKDVFGVFKSCKYHIAPCLAGKNRKISVVFVEDLVEGIVSAALSESSLGKTYFITNPEPVIWRDFVQEIAHIMDVRVLIMPVPKFVLRPFGILSDIIGRLSGKPSLFRTEKIDEMDQWYWICSSEQAHRDFGWIPRNTIDEALTKTYHWYANKGWL